MFFLKDVNFTHLVCRGTILLSLALSSCTGLGPRVLPPDRYGLNESLQSSDSQQLLLNIVRARYSDSPYFLGISAVTSVFNFNVNSATSFDYNKTSDGNTTYNALTPIIRNLSNSITKFFAFSVSPSSSYSQTPTISYSPLQGEVFTTQLLTPISLDQYFLLTATAWSAERVMRLTLQSMGDYENATGHAYDTNRRPEYQEFHKIARLIAVAQEKKVISFTIGKLGDFYRLNLIFNEDKRHSPEAKQLDAYFKQSPNTTNINFVAKSIFPEIKEKNYAPIVTRSVMGMLMYLSRGVQVPQEDIMNHRVQTYRLADGTLFDWTEVTRGMMTVKSSKRHPLNAAVSVRYRNRWFYIDDTDVDSKQTLALLEEIFALRAGTVQNVQPPLLSLRI